MFDFTGSPGVNPESGLNEHSSPLDCYFKFVSPETFEDIAEESNKYARSVLAANPPSPSSPARKWTPTSGGELMVFWALCMLMGVVGKPATHLNWSTRRILLTPFFALTMARDRFILLLRFLHFNDSTTAKPRDDPDFDPLHKLRPFYDKVTTAFHTVFTLFRSISVDEALIRFYGRLIFKTFNPRKPAKYGMKAYKICDVSGYTWKFKLYTGRTGGETILELVMSMMAGLLDKEYHLFMDSSPSLFWHSLKGKLMLVEQ
ncbi:piggyBac transposable element-derived protein 4-like [Lytechinus variegatus]|uniref:piggyBac transposable element-derived protein 4-like n=1 Tax=Lytechinus variegatus TaxID=7654 RepID=UPI001BB2612B|nr:piggyBac transposable element-derived protein 4-like [Lytechinus variegatus]